VQLEIETNIPVFYPRTAIEADLTISGEYFYVVEYDGDHIFNTENAAEEFIKEHPDGILKRIKKTLWNKRPVFQDGEIVDIKDIKEQMMEKIMVRK
jgi:hypothetical protein